MNDVAAYSLALADDSLILAQRLSAWVSRAPQVEEDIALANIGLDLLGQARALLAYAGAADGRSEDDLAYLRDEREFTNLQIVEQPGGDFGVMIARQLLFSTYQCALYERLRESADATLAAVAAKAAREVAYHRDHATQWTLRLGDGTAESHARMQAGLDRMWPHVTEMLAPFPAATRLAAAGIAVDPPTLRGEWEEQIGGVLAEATLERPGVPAATGGGRQGIHTEPFGYLLAEMQHLHRSHPGASW